jgi:hypothetical protein
MHVPVTKATHPTTPSTNRLDKWTGFDREWENRMLSWIMPKAVWSGVRAIAHAETEAGRVFLCTMHERRLPKLKERRCVT